jgi:hypothetical protein
MDNPVEFHPNPPRAGRVFRPGAMAGLKGPPYKGVLLLS